MFVATCWCAYDEHSQCGVIMRSSNQPSAISIDEYSLYTNIMWYCVDIELMNEYVFSMNCPPFDSPYCVANSLVENTYVLQKAASN